MARRQRLWAKRAYDRLIEELGGHCVKCGTVSGLTIDHIDGCEFDHNKLEWSHRISVYRREAAEGKLQVLCAQCNRVKGDPRDQSDNDLGPQLDLFVYVPPENPNEPF